jgi:glycosyltransferase involved in cell wall biosynthesis
MTNKTDAHIALLGSVGVPARYGGFETLAENLARYHADAGRAEILSIYCSRPAYPDRPERFARTELRYSRFRANGASSILYDATTLRDAIRRGVDVAVLLGVSGAVALPLLARRGTRIVTHVDGLEWRRDKWSAPARALLRWSERVAVQHSDAVIADSPAIADHLARTYGVQAEVIAYGGDHAIVAPDPPSPAPDGLPDRYALALCRIEPENNVHLILEAADATRTPLVVVGNWDSSAYGRALRDRFGGREGLHLLDPIHAPGPRYALRMRASAYIHGHSAGGTNPALVEMMHFGVPVLAYDCIFNRQTTEEKAAFFRDADGLASLLRAPPDPDAGATLRDIAQRRYRWSVVGKQYFDMLSAVAAR